MLAVVPPDRPPAYAWNWFARQQLLWREARARLAGSSSPLARRYTTVDTRPDVIARLRDDYPHHPIVRDVVQAAITELVFLGRTDEPFRHLGVRTPPRGMRWWWTAITGEQLARHPDQPPPGRQLTLDDVHEGYGG